MKQQFNYWLHFLLALLNPSLQMDYFHFYNLSPKATNRFRSLVLPAQFPHTVTLPAKVYDILIGLEHNQPHFQSTEINICSGIKKCSCGLKPIVVLIEEISNKACSSQLHGNLVEHSSPLSFILCPLRVPRLWQVCFSFSLMQTGHMRLTSRQLEII